MLSPKPWKWDAILRYITGLVICIFMGTLLGMIVGVAQGPEKYRTMQFFATAGGALLCFLGALVFLGRKWRFDQFTRNFITLQIFIYSGFALGWWATQLQGGSAPKDSTLGRLIVLLAALGTIVLLTHWFVRDHEFTWNEAFGFNSSPFHAILVALIVTLIILPPIWALHLVSVDLLTHSGLSPSEQLPVRALREAQTPAQQLVIGLMAIVVAPIGEEIFFRGILYPAIKRQLPRLALWLVAMLFGAVHFNIGTMVPLTALAIVLALLYEKTGNLLAPMLAHSLFNTVSFLRVYSPQFEEKVKWLFQQIGL